VKRRRPDDSAQHERQQTWSYSTPPG
jgi:hypothetical protein